MNNKKSIARSILSAGMSVIIIASASGCSILEQEKEPTLSDRLAEYDPTIPDELSNDLDSMQLVIDGQLLQMPFSYSDISDEFYIDMDQYNGRQTIPAYTMLTTMGGGIALQSDNWSEDLDFSVNFCNISDEEKDIEDCEIFDVRMDIIYTHGGEFPDFIMPGGITWGSTGDEIEAAYGETPNVYPGDGSTTYRYDNEVHYCSFVVSDTFGLISVIYTMNN